MSVVSTGFPAEGIRLDAIHHLFLVDLGGVFQGAESPERRAFVDLGAAVRFIGGRAAKLSAFLAPIGASADAATYGVVEEVFESSISDSFLLCFSNAPSIVVGFAPSTHKGAFEPYRRVYPTAGQDM